MSAPRGRPGPIVSVFGGSRAAEDSPEYRDAYQLGRLLATRGYTLCNGGYHGTMAAAARGAKDAQGWSIGITVGLLEHIDPNEWLDEQIPTPSLMARLEQLVTLGEAYVVLRGGIGTLLELALVWNLRQLQPTPQKPIVALGPDWHAVLDTMLRHLAVRDSDLAMVTRADTPEEAVAYLDAHFAGRDAPPSAPAPFTG